MFASLSTVAVAAPLALGAVPASVDPDDQAAAESAVAVFDERLAVSGWASTGPVLPTEPGNPADSEFGDCLGGLELYLDNSELRFDGETARAFSDNFELPAGEPASTDEFGGFGYAGAIVLVAEVGSVAVLDSFVERLGAGETPGCISSLPEFTSVADRDFAVATSITNQAGLGVGDASARLDIDVRSSRQDGDLGFALTFAAARTGRALAVVVVGGVGEFELPIDPVAELEAMIGSLG